MLQCNTMSNLLFLLFIFTQSFCATPVSEDVLSEGCPAKWHIVDNFPKNTLHYGEGLHIFVIKPENDTSHLKTTAELPRIPIVAFFQNAEHKLTGYVQVITNVETDQEKNTYLSVDVKTQHITARPGSVTPVRLTTPAIYNQKTTYPAEKVLHYSMAYDKCLDEAHFLRVTSSPLTPVKIEYLIGYNAEEIFCSGSPDLRDCYTMVSRRLPPEITKTIPKVDIYYYTDLSVPEPSKRTSGLIIERHNCTALIMH